MEEILLIKSLLGRTFLQEIYKKADLATNAARMPHSRNYKRARSNLALFLPKHCQISTKIFNWAETIDLIKATVEVGKAKRI